MIHDVKVRNGIISSENKSANEDINLNQSLKSTGF